MFMYITPSTACSLLNLYVPLKLILRRLHISPNVDKVFRIHKLHYKQNPLEFFFHYCIHGYFREFRESDLAKISTSIYVYL